MVRTMRIRIDPNGCWIWTGTISKSTGYGWIGNAVLGSEPAHRAVYRLFVGRLHSGWEVDHLCRNRLCVNPEHLELVKPQENLRRSNAPSAINARKTHCKRGHPFDEANTYISPKGERQCRACRAAAERAGRKRRNERAKAARLAERQPLEH